MKKMLKLSLNLDQLAVESFEIANERPMRGTVRGQDVCSDQCTATCQNTCGNQIQSGESDCLAMPRTPFCGDTAGVCNSLPCCV